MNAMDSSNLISWTMAHPDAATALATMALVAAGVAIGLGQIGVVFYGIWKMGEGNKARAEQHREAMDAEANRHQEAMDAYKATMDALAAERAASERRHEQAMQADERRHEQGMKALDALIRNTAPGAAPAA